MSDFDFEQLSALAEREKSTFRVEAELFELYNLIKDNFGLKAALENQKYPARFKINLLNQLMRGYCETTRALVAGLAEDGLIHRLYQLSHGFSVMVCKKQNCLLGEMVCAHPPTPPQIQSAEKILAKKFGRPVRLKSRLDPSILGGLVIKTLQGTIIDLSLRNQLTQLQAQIAAAT